MRLLFGYITLLLITGCTATKLPNYDFPKPVDTSSREIQMQEKGSWTIDGVTVSNDFDGARMNGFSQIDDSTFNILILPENEPINKSPWYAFTIASESPRTVYIQMDYGTYDHRYWPKMSTDLETWTRIDTAATNFSNHKPIFRVDIDATAPIYFCGQELANSSMVFDWFDGLIADNGLTKFEVGKSKLGRSLVGAMNTPMEDDAEVICFISRQHPPEVSGYKGLQSFLDEVFSDTELARAFRKKYRILIYPLLNPDGVDLGHWRHNAGGIDLNRDWQYYRQPEVNQIANHIYDFVKSKKTNLIFGADFHSTQKDIYYTFPGEHEHIMDFRKYWIESIEEVLGEGNAYEEPDPIESPVSKGWFVMTFGGDAVTYEVGDETPRDFIDKKARVGAQEMMKLLILRER